jgi:hypothetical protein
MNLTSIRPLQELKIKEDAPKIDSKNWPKTMDALCDYFSCVLGATKAPLAYVIRDVVEVPPEADNPANNYDMPKDETIYRMSHQDDVGADLPTYKYDRSKVWQTMSKVCPDEKCRTLCQTPPMDTQRSQDLPSTAQPLLGSQPCE